MARALNKLAARRVATETRKGRYSDGGGLWLQVGEAANKSWLFRFQLNGRKRQMGLGAVHTVSLADARQEAARCRQLIRDGIDPIEERKAILLDRRTQAGTAKTFKQCAESYIKQHAPKWSNVKHAAQWTATLETYAYPVIGTLGVGDVDTPQVLDILEPIWSEKPETASRVRGRIEAILDWAIARKHREGENPARWRGHLNKILPARSKRSKKHHAALPYPEINTFVTSLREQPGMAARALEFLILTGTRTGEVLGARWSEIDFTNSCWNIPGERTKTGADHRVPLSGGAVAILRVMEDLKSSDFVFPGARPKSPLSNMSMLAVLKRMGRADLTSHGFRSTFKDWASECTRYPNEVSEAALGHAIPSAVEAAYRRGDLFDKRVRLMSDWAAFVARPVEASGTVVSIQGSTHA
ncbi:tyrosine-type recombinase/integrase [Rhodospirillaceae bacterium KN72]|uniref:Tyrosine-type recombinase/integrase n=1 Tax=Pacificispira spongiicola TaxID=2729598 RepID=A0A7Y0E2C5_9PROT|nr:integrase arm-type DNA-binding domain-containing protein [Pacificispira spongiicola]NMM45958.1 tyrosine-type recombinase/integrase [Pacificispira spongiicola]